MKRKKRKQYSTRYQSENYKIIALHFHNNQAGKPVTSVIESSQHDSIPALQIVKRLSHKRLFSFIR